ncbi:lymphotoxin-alpha-like [Xyrichtys novacula]|uniref:Lymphotoxin-alpha-like n=1 Tax=Xyrichtys novacula TaxID=13765 RepID=A0AAV1G6V3_XYRNO|nr:lymphotoxin-alpha-like [Xyrichtys novacula]
MEEDYEHNALIQHLRQEQRRLRRLSQLIAVALFLLISVVLVLLTTTVLGARAHSPECEPTVQPYRHSPDETNKQQQHTDFRNPSAMLTAPRERNSGQKYLEWESEDGNAHCYGGFNYSRGSLVVPRRGIYRVFFQITHEGGACDSKELKLINTVFMSKEKYKRDVPLLSSVNAVTCNPEWWSKSLYTSGLFLLDVNSRLAVKSTHSEFIAKGEEQVFFGAELVFE